MCGGYDVGVFRYSTGPSALPLGSDGTPGGLNAQKLDRLNSGYSEISWETEGVWIDVKRDYPGATRGRFPTTRRKSLSLKKRMFTNRCESKHTWAAISHDRPDITKRRTVAEAQACFTINEISTSSWSPYRMTFKTDEALMEKIETHAGTVNDVVLSEPEVRRSKEIYREQERILSDLDRQIDSLIAQRTTQQQRMNKFCIALAPHKNLPSEVLSQIFLHCIPENISRVLPSKCSEAPWVLGHVTEFRRTLTRVCEILPAPVRLTLPLKANVENVRTIVLPHLWRVGNLLLEMSIEAYDELWRAVSPHSLMLLECADLRIEESPSTSEHRESRWDGAAPFRLASRLRELTLKCPEAFNSAILSLNIPWSQLTFLDITDMKNLTLVTIVQMTQMCSALECLRVQFQRMDTTSVPHFPDVMPLLRQLSIKDYVPALLIDGGHVWDYVSVLHIAEAEFQDNAGLHSTLRRCTRLVTLYASVPPKDTAFIIPSDVHLPHLEVLELSSTQNSWIFECVTVSALKDLRVFFKEHQPDLHSIRNMIVRSGCTLLYFNLVYHGMPVPLPSHLTDVYELLNAIPDAVTIGIQNIQLTDNIWQDLARCILLPRLVHLTSTESSLNWDAFIKVIEMRLDAELQRHKSTLRDIVVIRLLWPSHDGRSRNSIQGACKSLRC
ncbi:hypothetical protein FPV67DRAFT_1654098 [Lyophyllum atratum]|nr:hypothetical protein FPV67DRAFT_1654098 [Lyophyllum atratum]